MSMYRVSAKFYPKDRRKNLALMVAIVLADSGEEAIEKYKQHEGPLDGWYVSATKLDADVYVIRR